MKKWIPYVLAAAVVLAGLAYLLAPNRIVDCPACGGKGFVEVKIPVGNAFSKAVNYNIIRYPCTYCGQKARVTKTQAGEILKKMEENKRLQSLTPKATAR